MVVIVVVMLLTIEMLTRELRDEEENNLEVTPITFNGEGELGTLHQVAYYENPGILMIVQSVGDQEGSKLNQGEITAHHKRSLVIVQWRG